MRMQHAAAHAAALLLRAHPCKLQTCLRAYGTLSSAASPNQMIKFNKTPLIVDR
jgi:hypothetical protein